MSLYVPLGDVFNWLTLNLYLKHLIQASLVLVHQPAPAMLGQADDLP